MKIHGLTVCVDYAEELAIGLPRWTTGLSSLTVITAHRDVDTITLARYAGAHLSITEAFYLDGAAFNKGRALEEARRDLVAREQWALRRADEWILLFDADVVPPVDWSARLSGCTLGYLYGCKRFAGTPEALEDRGQPDLPGDVAGVGYCQLFHSADPVVIAAGPALIDQCWVHAGNYDNRLMDKWRSGRLVRPLPFRLAHLGARENWFGRGHRAEFLAMQAERKRRGGKWDHERIGGSR